MKQISLILISSILLTVFACSESKKKPSITPLTFHFKKEGELTLKKGSNDSLIAKLDIEFAETAYETQTGLMHRKNMENNRGMLFILKEETQQAFYMKNTKISLDIIFLNSAKEIVSFQENTNPLDETPLPSTVPAKYVLEINAGLAKLWQLEIGDKAEWVVLNK